MATKKFSKTKDAAWKVIGALGLLILATNAGADPVRVGVNGSRPAHAARPAHPGARPAPGRPTPVVRPGPRRPGHPERPPVVGPRRPGRPVVVPSRRPVVRPVRAGDTADQRAEFIIRRAMMEGGCGQLAEIVRRLSNQLASDFNWATRPGAVPPGRERNRRVIIDEMARSREFWERIWERVTEAYRSCDYECFDDGEAVGLMSGLGYCAASVAAEGLPGPGVAITPPLPLCETAIFAGCERGYRAAAFNYEGCREFSSGDYDRIFREFMSQDCQIPDGEEVGSEF